VDEILLAIRNIKSHRSTVVIATGADPENEFLLLEAGADAVLLRPLDPEKLKYEVRRVMELAQPSATPEAPRWSLSGALFRGFQRLTNA
jgi:DNA-binding response OmpR family regulator